MAKISKYEKMVGQVVDGVLVSDYRKTQKESLKTGRSYYKYEVELENIIWISTTAFNRKTYGRKLDKARQFSTDTKDSKPKPKPSQEPVKDKPKETKSKTKTKQEQKLAEEYDYWFNYYKNLLDGNFRHTIKGVCEESYTFGNGKKPTLKKVMKKVYNIYREPYTDFTAKTKFTNERRRNQNKAYNDAWKSLEITDEKVKEILETQWLLAITDRIMQGALEGKGYAKRRYELLVDMLEDGDSFIDYNGYKKYKDAEEYFNFWNDITLDEARNPYKDLDEDMRWQMENSDYCIGLDTTYLEEWLTEWQEKFHQAVYELWSKVEEYFKKFEEEWYKENFGSSKAKKGFNKFDNEFDKLKDAREIKKLYRKLSKENHPDVGGNETDFIQLKDAYDRAMARVA